MNETSETNEMNEMNEMKEMKEINDIILQAPVNMTDEEIKEIYYFYDKNASKTLEVLWNINIVEKKKKRTILDNVRETCDAYDTEMHKVMNKNNNNN